MIIWLVTSDKAEEITCAFTERKDAIKYFKAECKICDWKWKLSNGDENMEDEYLFYTVECDKIYCRDNDNIFTVKIIPICLDAYPYFFVKNS